MESRKSNGEYELFPQDNAYHLNEIIDELIDYGIVRLGGDAPGEKSTASRKQAGSSIDQTYGANSSSILAFKAAQLLGVDLPCIPRSRRTVLIHDVIQFYKKNY